MIVPISDAHIEAWLHLRRQLWPHCTDSEHRSEMDQFLGDASRFAQFICLDEQGAPMGFAEASIRSDHVNGTRSSPVAFLEGIFVEPRARQSGIARGLVEVVSDWARGQGLSELASDADLSNTTSHAVHNALGFEETERAVFFRMSLDGGRGT
ncbi:MAG: GNAT family N-acetyltransferase [Pseudomonadales bacterium]